MDVSVAAIIVTFRREAELRRLLHSLAQSTRPLEAIVVVDNARDPACQGLAENGGASYVPSANLGPGAGWKLGMETVLERMPGLTHFLVLDDDVELPADALQTLLEAARQTQAGMVAPLLVDQTGEVWAFPEPLEWRLRKVIRGVKTRADAVKNLGEPPVPFAWCTGACVLVTTEVVRRVGFHRTDFWMLGEDLEFSMRVSSAEGGVFLPNLFVPHLPPAGGRNPAGDRAKFCSLLQNLAYLSFYYSESRHLKWYLPGNFRRYIRTYGWRHGGEALQSIFNGLLGQAAGTASGKVLRQRIQNEPAP